MPEELRVFVRAALYVALATVVYVLVSDDLAGALLLAFLFAGAVVFVLLARAIGRRPAQRMSLIALDDEGGEAAPLEVEEEPVVTASAWPLLGAAAAMLVGLGLLYGPWLWVPGAGLAIAAAYGWITQTDA
jgi:hypothetical protein